MQSITHSQMSSSFVPGYLSTSSAPVPKAKTFRVSMNWLKFSPKALRTQGQLYSANNCTAGQQHQQAFSTTMQTQHSGCIAEH